MANKTITLPELGEGVDSVDVVAVLVAVGDMIELDQGLIEVETEKASVEVPSTSAGSITEIHVQTGDVLGENAPIVTLEASEGEAEAATEEIAPVPEPAPEIAEENITERVENPKSEIRIQHIHPRRPHRAAFRARGRDRSHDRFRQRSRRPDLDRRRQGRNESAALGRRSGRWTRDGSRAP